MKKPLWQASAIRQENSSIKKFMDFVHLKRGHKFQNYNQLHSWSVTQFEDFWFLVSEFCQIHWIEKPEVVFQCDGPNPFIDGKWFQRGKLNYAQNLLGVTKEHNKEGNKESSEESREESSEESKKAEYIRIISLWEDGIVQEISNTELFTDVAKLASSMRTLGIKKGDVVAGVLSNTFQSIIIMLATSSLGAIFSSCSPDFGFFGISDRLNQLNPKLLFFQSEYQYNGKYFDCFEIIQKLAKCLKNSKIILVGSPFSKKSSAYNAFEELKNFLDPNPKPLEFEAMDFSDPLFILFSSGTTGLPKCIVHSVGGTLLQHKKELILHTDLKPFEKLMFFTTLGWMMWNWSTSALSNNSCVVTYDGSPSYKKPEYFLELAQKHKVEVLGTSPKYIQTCMQERVSLKNSSFKTILTTGSPLSSEQFEYIYSDIQKDVHLASISGGTDIISCFMLGNPLLPVYSGEIQSPGLGMAIDAFDNTGVSSTSLKGELVCTQPFVSVPIGFINDPGHEKFRQAYFTNYPDKIVWHHGDFIEFTDHHGIIVHGRSDATLNPQGVRIGTAEIYRCLEMLPEIEDSLAVGLEENFDVKIVLFLKLKLSKEKVDLGSSPLKKSHPGTSCAVSRPPCRISIETSSKAMSIDENFIKKVKAHIKKELSPRHVPHYIFQVTQIPYTRNGKKVELAVTHILNNRPVNNTSSLADPCVLEEYKIVASQILSKEQGD